MFKSVRKNAYRLVVAQAFVVGVLFIAFWVFQDIKAGYSVILGGLSSILPGIYFVKKLLSDKERSAGQIVRDFYVGELLKLLFSFILLFLILFLMPVKLVPLLSGYMGVYLAVWLTPFFIK